jgi:hypothetical protein
MPILQNPRQEAFAQARARGARLGDASEEAGYAVGGNHGSRLASMPEVAERIAELRAAQEHFADCTEEAVIATLARLAKAGEKALTGPAALKEIRQTVLDLSRLLREQAADRSADRKAILAFQERLSRENQSVR